jgi:cytochrome b6-f complex iron-sulfur subunit
MPENSKSEDSKVARSGDIGNRRFFLKLGLGSLGIAAAGTVAFAYQYLEPNVLYEPSPVVNVGKPERYALNSVMLDVNSGIYIIHSQEGFFSLSAVCTHLGCLTTWQPETNQINCPCHGSKFDRDGAVVTGPAPKPLPWLKMWMNDDGDLLVDRATKVAPQKEYVRA